MAYAELRVKTAFSFQRGAAMPDALCARAAELGLAGLGICDINSLAGVVRGMVAAEARGLPLLIGAELELRDAAPVLCFAQDRAGYGRLSRLISEGRLRAPKGDCELELRDLLGAAEGLIAIAAPGRDERGLDELAGAFGERLYIGAERLLRADDGERIARRLALSRRLGRPLVATNDVRYDRPEGQDLMAVMSCLREHCSLRDAGRRLEANGERHLKSERAMQALFAPFAPEAVDRSVEVLERCRFSLRELRYEYPEEVVPGGESEAQALRRLAYEGAERRYPAGLTERTRGLIEHELALIAELGYEPYFLTVYDLVRFARERKILCQGRGSAANSVVCFCLGITEVDPERHELLFERFVSAERGEPPDIDVDFEHERREEVIQYVYERYGRRRAGMTATVIRYRERSALRDVGRAFGFDDDGLDRLVKGAAGWRGEAASEEDLRAAGWAGSDGLRPVLEKARELYGMPRHLSQHVGGLVVTRGRLDELVPIENAAMEGRTVIEWDKDDIDALGLLKVDILALGMLTALRRAFLLIDEPVWAGQGSLRELAEDNPKRAFAAIVAEDQGGDGRRPMAAATYEMLCQADAVGVFQVESRAQRAMLPRLRPRRFYDLVIEVAIVRPGPIQGDMVNPYLKRRDGAPWDYPHPCTREVLERTLGVPLFQEQVMQLAVVAAGFTPAEADGLRRAMGAWRSAGVMERYRAQLMEGFAARGISARFAEQIYKQIEGFGSYGFPESHAASFALIAYVSAWVKRFHPAAFTAALLNSQPMGFYTPSQLVRDAREHGVELRPADVDASGWDCRLEDARPSNPRRRLHLPPRDWGRDGPALRLGLRLLRGLREEVGRRVEAARCDGPFASLADLKRRAELRRADLEVLARGGALGSLGLSRREALWRVLGLEDGEGLFADLPPPESRARLPAASEAEEVFADMRQVGVSLRRHPVALLRLTLTELGAAPASRLAEARHGESLCIAGMVTLRQRPGTARGVLFLTLEDESGEMNLIVPPPVVRRCKRVARHAPLILARGRVERAGAVVHLLVRHLEALPRELMPVPVRPRSFR